MRLLSGTLCACCLFAGALPPGDAQADETSPNATASGERVFTFYIQQAWPKQTKTNDQIHQINQIFGTDFDDWGDIANLSLGGQVLWPVARGWQVGLQVDYGSGSIGGNTQVTTEAGPAKLSFEQRYDVYADLYAAAKWNPWPDSKEIQPFLYGAVGVAYQSSWMTLKLRNDYIDSKLRVTDDAWFPTYTAGIGMDLPVSATSPWFVELGVAYVWAHVTHQVPAHGDLAPSPKVTADTDLTGPNVWVGVGRRF